MVKTTNQMMIRAIRIDPFIVLMGGQKTRDPTLGIQQPPFYDPLV